MNEADPAVAPAHADDGPHVASQVKFSFVNLRVVSSMAACDNN